MNLQCHRLDITVDLEYDEDGFPEINLQSDLPKFAVKLCGVFIRAEPPGDTRLLVSMKDDNVTIEVYDRWVNIILNGFTGEHERPTAEIKVNDKIVHEMLSIDDDDNPDTRWEE